MSYADWKKRSKRYQDMMAGHGIGRADAEEVAQAAYKAGEREGRKQVEAVAWNGAKPEGDDEGKTPWFPATAKPKRPGYYEKRWWKEFRYFDGTHWRRGGPDGDIVAAPEWCGMARNTGA